MEVSSRECIAAENHTHAETLEIDAVIMWVNGSDPLLLGQIAEYSPLSSPKRKQLGCLYYNPATIHPFAKTILLCSYSI